MALFSGWVYLIKPVGGKPAAGAVDADSAPPTPGSTSSIGSGGGGGNNVVVVPRLMTLMRRTILLYRRDPKHFPDEEPASRGVAGPAMVVEECGRESFPNAQPLHVFRIYSKDNENEGGGKIGCTTAEAAQQWVTVLREAAMRGAAGTGALGIEAEEISEGGGPDGAEAHSLVAIGKGVRGDTVVDLHSVEVGEDAVESMMWHIFKVDNGLRFFEAEQPSEEAAKSRLLKAEGVVSASADDIFEVVMSSSAAIRRQWDCFLRDTRIVSTVDGYTDICHAVVAGIFDGRVVEANLVTKRTWRRNQDGSYVICNFPAPEESVPLDLEKKVRFSGGVGTWEIVPLTPANPYGGGLVGVMGSMQNRCLVRYMLEVELNNLGMFAQAHMSKPVSASTREASSSIGAEVGEIGSSSARPASSHKHSSSSSGSKGSRWKLGPISIGLGGAHHHHHHHHESSTSSSAVPFTASAALGGEGARAASMSRALAEKGDDWDFRSGDHEFEDFAGGILYSSMVRIAGLREYFASLPSAWYQLQQQQQLKPAAAGGVASPRTSAMSAPIAERQQRLEQLFKRSESYAAEESNEEFYDPVDSVSQQEIDKTAKQARARKNWQGLKWAVILQSKLQSLFEESAEEAESWEVRRELIHKSPAVDLPALLPKLVASASVKPCANGSDSASAPTTPVPKDASHGWRDPGGQNFCLRGPNYLEDRVKIPASSPLLQLVGMDWFKDDNKRIDHVCARPGTLAQSEAGQALPFLLAVNLQVPGKPNYSLVAYFGTIYPLRPNSLLHRFVNSDDTFRNARLKLIPRIDEGHWMVKRAVGTKACLLGKALTCSWHRGSNYLEMDCDIGSSSVARNVIGLVISYVTSLVVDLAIVIEAQEAAELPEYLLAAMTCVRIEPKLATVPPPLP